MEEVVSLAEASRRIDRPANAITQAIHRGALDASAFPIVAGRRVVPVRLLGEIKAKLDARPAVRGAKEAATAQMD